MRTCPNSTKCRSASSPGTASAFSSPPDRSAGQRFQDRLVQRAVRGEDAFRAEANRLALEVRHATARLLDDHGERRDVEHVDVRLEDGVDLAGGEQGVVQEVAKAADSVDARDQPA